jgi:hypothetical protein
MPKNLLQEKFPQIPVPVLPKTFWVHFGKRYSDVLEISVKLRIFYRVASDTDFAGYSTNLKAGYRISGRVSSRNWNPTFRSLENLKYTKTLVVLKVFSSQS